MTFWTARNVATQQPFNFYVEFKTKNHIYVAWEVKNVQLPTFGQEIIIDDYGNEKEYSKGPIQWNSFKIDLYDLAGITYREENGIKGFWEVDNLKTSTSFTISQWISDTPGFEEHAVPNKDASTVANRWNITVVPKEICIYKIYTNKKLPSDEETESSKFVNKWTIKNPVIEQVDFGQLDYSSEDPVLISITMRPKSNSDVTVTSETIK